jgi:hypothetical protein
MGLQHDDAGESVDVHVPLLAAALPHPSAFNPRLGNQPFCWFAHLTAVYLH